MSIPKSPTLLPNPKRGINLLVNSTMYSALAQAVALLGLDHTDVSLLGSGPWV